MLNPIYLLTCPNVQLQQCLPLPPVEKLLHFPFPSSLEKWRLENTAAVEPSVPGEFQTHGRQARSGLSPWLDQGLACTFPVQADLGFQPFSTPL